MSVFDKRNQPQRDDICMCRHKYIDHDTETKFCLRRPCPCMYYVRLSARTAKMKSWVGYPGKETQDV